MQLLKQEQQAKPSAMMALAARCNVDPAKLTTALRETVFKDATDAELLALVVVSNQYDLNPFLKEIHAFKGRTGGIVPIVGIDGWLKIINSHPQLDGLEVTISDDGESAVCSIWRKDRTRPITLTEYLKECYRPTDPWKQSPRRMLRHKAIIQTARVAFGFSGIYADDEIPEAEPQPKKLKIVPAAIERTIEPEAPKKPEAAPESQQSEGFTLAMETEGEPLTLTDLMQRDGISTDNVIRALEVCGVIKKGAITSIADIPEKVKQDAVTDWQTIVEIAGGFAK
jgi:phage recombination protein Bet